MSKFHNCSFGDDLKWGDNPYWPWKNPDPFTQWPPVQVQEENLDPVSKEEIYKIINIQKEKIYEIDKKTIIKRVNGSLRLGNLSVKIEKNLINDLDSLPKVKKIYEEKGWSIKEASYETVVVWEFS